MLFAILPQDYHPEKIMRFLHTSDWHLGQKLIFKDREQEHQLALDWLREVILRHEVDALIVSGDIFDIGNPPNYARRLYYRFLTGLLNSCCRHVVITGGNHDSPAMLEAPRELLEALNVHVVGAATEDLSDEVIELRTEEGAPPRAVVAAVPFLRDRDLRFAVAGETGADRVQRIREGIRRHYEQVAAIAERYSNADIPIVATGHLFASGAQAADKQDNIYIGDVENIDAEELPAIFSYVALGHIHRPQRIGDQDRVRYSGSLIPLSFSETKDEKGVFLVDFAGRGLKEVTFVPAPTFRRLKTIQGSLEEVKQRLRQFAEKGGRDLPPWVEVIVETDQVIPQLDIELQEFTAEMDLELLKIRLSRNYHPLDAQTSVEEDLNALDDLEVFRKKCQSYGALPDEQEELEATFRELKGWMVEIDDD